MKKKIIQLVGVFLFLFVIGSLMSVRPCQAASAEVVINSDITDITVGDNITVYININSDTPFGNFEANVTYDDDILQYEGGESAVTGSSGFLKISDMNVVDGVTSRSYTLKFEALKVGLCEISFSGRAMVYDFDSGLEMSVSSNVLTLNIKAPVTASTDAKLKSLKTSPSELTPVFDPDIFEYTVNVGYDTEQLIITALPEDPKSTVSISGNDSLKEGENKVVITVLAESGNNIEYNINVIREYATATSPTGEAVISPAALPDTFEFIEIDGIKYATYSGKYTLIEPGSDVSVPDGFILGSLTISGITIPAYLPVNNQESEFILIYAANEYNEAGFYRYDRIEKTLQRFDPNSMFINEQHVVDSADAIKIQEYNNNLRTAVIVIALLSGFCILMIFVTVRMLFKLKGFKEDDIY